MRHLAIYELQGTKGTGTNVHTTAVCAIDRLACEPTHILDKSRHQTSTFIDTSVHTHPIPLCFLRRVSLLNNLTVTAQDVRGDGRNSILLR